MKKDEQYTNLEVKMKNQTKTAGTVIDIGEKVSE